jgi:hypothetical protein
MDIRLAPTPNSQTEAQSLLLNIIKSSDVLVVRNFQVELSGLRVPLLLCKRSIDRWTKTGYVV